MDAEEFSWEVRVAAGPDAATVYARTQRFEIGVPLSFDREEPRATALEHLLGAFGADLAMGLRRAAKRRRVVVDSVEAVVEARLHRPLAVLRVVGEEGDPGVKSLRVRVYVSTPHPAAEIEAIWQETLALSPLAATLRRSVDLDLSVKTVL